MRTTLFVTLILPLLITSPAFADDTAAQAKARFQAGAQAYREARYKDAIDLFLQANRLDPHAELVYNVGQAYEKLGDVPNALRSYREYLRLAPSAGDRATVETSIRNLEARLREKGLQQVTVFSSPAGATLLLDQKSVGQTPWTGEIAPGRHVLVLRATGFSDTAKEFVLVGDRAMDLDIALSTLGAGATAQAAARPDAALDPRAVAPSASDAPKPSTGVRPWTFAAFGLGVAGFGGALGFELARRGSERSAREAPQVAYASEYDAMIAHQTTARAMAVVGAVGVAAGGVLLYLDLRSKSSSPRPRAAMGCLGTTCGAFASGRF
jgi:tetratricopeptide (TPR) repeat protein